MSIALVLIILFTVLGMILDCRFIGVAVLILALLGK